ncbi:MAG TPA: META domain-containing protein [Methanoregulaceae archaeon]|nr:META domain-containing protein [Methanoregulaceae archaeon]
MKKLYIVVITGLVVLMLAFTGCTTQPPPEQPATTPTPTQEFTPVSTTVETPAPPQVMLTGVTWYLVSFDNGILAAENVITGTEITSVFGEDAKLTGSGGCNNYFASYETGESGAIGIGTIGSTLMICQTPTGIDNQEQMYFAMLGGVESYSIDGELLKLKDNTRDVIATYTNVPPALE